MTNPGMRNATAPLCPNEELPRAACLMISPDRADAARFLIRNTTPDERIFSGLARHDRVYVNDVAIYFITARLPATHWHQFDPGVQNSAEIQKSIVADLEASAVRYVMLSSEWDSIAEPNESTQSSGVRLLDDYIRQNFKTVKRFGEIEILLRNRESFRAAPR